MNFILTNYRMDLTSVCKYLTESSACSLSVIYYNLNTRCRTFKMWE